MEILISMLTFALITAGLANVFLATRGLGLHTRSRMTVGELGRYYLERLQMHVREDTWGNPPNHPTDPNLLTVGDYRSANFPDQIGDDNYSGYTIVYDSEEAGFEEPTLNNITYYPAYSVESVNGLRKVKLIIYWQEPSG